ncbi:Basic-leucine zipper domain [Phaffia rhodozyma]|uniref:Basic-leucine zipper domain n=1 Tax=Phaffia rhodozyma TaxID=264483 RepID=A0A0F7SJ84_PHARH|nr:Basic-leucine zipper domain [Phaffia rhodozyma]
MSYQPWLQAVLTKSLEDAIKPLDFWNMDSVLLSGSPVDSASSPESTEEAVCLPTKESPTAHLTGWENYFKQPNFFSSPDSVSTSPSSVANSLPGDSQPSSFPPHLVMASPSQAVSEPTGQSPAENASELATFSAPFLDDVLTSSPHTFSPSPPAIQPVSPRLTDRAASDTNHEAQDETKDSEEDEDGDGEESEDSGHCPTEKRTADSPLLSASNASIEMPQKTFKQTARRAAGGHLMSRVVIEEGEERGPDDDWRPSPEEYKTLSSKQKRQLRNKISARNFRNRRKDYITALEGHLGERDRLIAAVKDELGSTKWENEALRREIMALKNAVSLRGSSPTNTPSPLPFTGTTVNPSQLKATSSSSQPTTSAVSSSSIATTSSAPQPNLNPLFNYHTPITHIPFHMSQPVNLPTGTSQTGTFDQFIDSTPFGVRNETVEAWKNQLWTRLAREEAWGANSSVTNSGLKPAFWTSSASSSVTPSPSSPPAGSLGAILVGLSYKAPSISAPPPPPYKEIEHSLTDETGHAPSSCSPGGGWTIANRLSKAFMDAFVTPTPGLTPPTPLFIQQISTGNSASSSSRQKTDHQTSHQPYGSSAALKAGGSFDYDKLASLLAGRSRIEIVPNSTPISSKVNIGPVSSFSPAAGPSTPRDACRALDLIMQSLSLGSSGCSSSSFKGRETRSKSVV